MLFSISGSQGQGKTTVINEISKDPKYANSVLVNKTSRGILKDWGYTLNEVNKYGPLTRNFQQEIMNRFIEFSTVAIESKEVFITERSWADIFSYALFVLGPFNEYSEWLDDYYNKCKHLQSKFAGVFYLSGRVYQPEDDGVRSINRHYANAVDLNIKYYIHDLADNAIIIDTPDLDERVNLIKTYIDSCKLIYSYNRSGSA